MTNKIKLYCIVLYGEQIYIFEFRIFIQLKQPMLVARGQQRGWVTWLVHFNVSQMCRWMFMISIFGIARSRLVIYRPRSFRYDISECDVKNKETNNDETERKPLLTFHQIIKHNHYSHQHTLWGFRVSILE